jgi:hypothetical protein
MRLFESFRAARSLLEYERLNKQFAQIKGIPLMSHEAACALLLVQEWKLTHAGDIPARASLLSRNLNANIHPDSRETSAIALLMFAKRIGRWKAMGRALPVDPFFTSCGCLYGAVTPLTDFARRLVNRIWNGQRVNTADALDASFASYYATLIAPFAIDSWIMLAELRHYGICPEIDDRDHVSEGVKQAEQFLATAKNADPGFRELIAQGISQLARMAKRRPSSGM